MTTKKQIKEAGYDCDGLMEMVLSLLHELEKNDISILDALEKAENIETFLLGLRKHLREV